jgi:hypothetical protein
MGIRNYIEEEFNKAATESKVDKFLEKRPEDFEKGIKQASSNLLKELKSLEAQYPEEADKFNNLRKKINKASKDQGKFSFYKSVDNAYISDAIAEFRDASLRDRVNGIAIGAVGTAALVVANTKAAKTIDSILKKRFPKLPVSRRAPVVMAIAAMLIAPITEEVFKYITVKLNKKNIIPTTTFALAEMGIYLYRGVASGANMLAVLLLIFARLLAVKMHLSTAKDMKAAQDVKGNTKKEVAKGALRHFLWNFGGGIGGVTHMARELYKLVKRNSALAKDMNNVIG